MGSPAKSLGFVPPASEGGDIPDDPAWAAGGLIRPSPTDAAAHPARLP